MNNGPKFLKKLGKWKLGEVEKKMAKKKPRKESSKTYQRGRKKMPKKREDGVDFSTPSSLILNYPRGKSRRRSPLSPILRGLITDASAAYYADFRIYNPF